MTAAAAERALHVADWRRHVFKIYDLIRGAAEPSIGHALWCRDRDSLFAHHPSSPILPADRVTFTGLPVARYDPRWRFEVPLLPSEEDRHFDFQTGTDGVVSFDLIGTVTVPDVGELDVWCLTSYGGGIFLPVKDALAGRKGGTYPGGRYLLDTVKGADLGVGPASASLVVDFNFAYNPSCAYDPAWACPLAPRGNHVGVEIPVGELYNGSH